MTKTKIALIAGTLCFGAVIIGAISSPDVPKCDDADVNATIGSIYADHRLMYTGMDSVTTLKSEDPKVGECQAGTTYRQNLFGLSHDNTKREGDLTEVIKYSVSFDDKKEHVLVSVHN